MITTVTVGGGTRVTWGVARAAVRAGAAWGGGIGQARRGRGSGQEGAGVRPGGGSGQEGAEGGGEGGGDVGDQDVAAVPDHVVAAATTSVTSAAVPAKITDSSAVAGAARPPGCVQAHRDQVGQRAGRDLPRLRPAQAGVPGDGGRRGQRGGREVAALPGGQPFVQLDAAGLVQQVDHGVAVAAHRERAARRSQRPRWADPVGQEGFRGRAQADAGTAGAQQFDVVAGQWVACTIVLRGPRAPAPSSTRAGVAP